MTDDSETGALLTQSVLRRLRDEADGDPAAVKKLLQEFPRIGPTGADIFCREVQQVTGDHIDVVIADQGYTGEQPQIDASLNDVELVVVKRPTGATGFVLLPLRWVVERTFAWTARFRRLSRDLERLQSSLLGFHWLAVSVTLLNKLKPILGSLA